jgi:glycerol-3-phosphate dehydrogenase (NAD(P)+)
MPRTVVIGTGTWGTAMAVILHHQRQPVALFGRDPAKVAALAAAHRHPQLGDLALPIGLELTADPAALADADLILWAVPTQHSRALARELAAAIPASVPLVSLAKGLEEQTLATPCALLADTLGERPIGVLSGPSHAFEIVAGQLVCLVVAGPGDLPRLVQERVHGQRCRVYTSPDRLGVELGGALKNVIAIAAGLCDGLGIGDNLKAALITRGLAEMRRLGRVMGAQDATFAGMAGIGDLLTTCYAPHGRNRALGKAIASGANPLMFLRQQQTVAEGAWTCRAAVELARQHAVELPIASQVASIIWDGTPVRAAMDALFARSPKEEDA